MRITQPKAISVTDLELVGNRPTVLGRSYRVKHRAIGMRFNSTAQHVYGQHIAYKPWSFIGYAKNEDEAKKLYVKWVNLRLKYFQ